MADTTATGLPKRPPNPGRHDRPSEPDTQPGLPHPPRLLEQ